MAGYYLLPAARADLLRRLGRRDDARREYEQAVRLSAADRPERRLLLRRLEELDQGSG
jgi:RNA polymerase sigma-70 factor (ECF subfamily)